MMSLASTMMSLVSGESSNDNRNSFLDLTSLTKPPLSISLRSTVSLYQKLLKVLPANFLGPNHSIHSKVNWRQKLWKIHVWHTL